ncbi:MAG: hypothetical protein V2A73_06335 [Pseudomonadota bacterium]
MTEAQLQAAHRAMRSGGVTLAEYLVLAGVLDEERLCAFFRERFLVPRVDKTELTNVSRTVVAKVPVDMAVEFRVVPVSADADGGLLIAMADPSDSHAVDEISFFTGAYVMRAVAPVTAIAVALQEHYGIVTPPLRAAQKAAQRTATGSSGAAPAGTATTDAIAKNSTAAISTAGEPQQPAWSPPTRPDGERDSRPASPPTARPESPAPATAVSAAGAAQVAVAPAAPTKTDSPVVTSQSLAPVSTDDEPIIELTAPKRQTRPSQPPFAAQPSPPAQPPPTRIAGSATPPVGVGIPSPISPAATPPAGVRSVVPPTVPALGMPPPPPTPAGTGQVRIQTAPPSAPPPRIPSGPSAPGAPPVAAASGETDRLAVADATPAEPPSLGAILGISSDGTRLPPSTSFSIVDGAATLASGKAGAGSGPVNTGGTPASQPVAAPALLHSLSPPKGVAVIPQAIQLPAGESSASRSTTAPDPTPPVTPTPPLTTTPPAASTASAIRAIQAAPAVPAVVSAKAAAPAAASPRANKALKEVLEKLKTAADRDAIALALVDYLASLYRRSVFFVLRKGALCGWVGKGVGVREPALRESKLILDVPSTFQDIVSMRLPFWGPIIDPPSRDFLIDALGWAPESMLAVPVSVRSRVVGVLYGDDREHEAPEEDLARLTRAAAEALERALLTRKGG